MQPGVVNRLMDRTTEWAKPNFGAVLRIAGMQLSVTSPGPSLDNFPTGVTGVRSRPPGKVSSLRSLNRLSSLRARATGLA